MEFVIIGSGGCVCTPKPLCHCSVCAEARAKGYPYARCGCSLYLKDIALLVDTPEDIAVAINNADLQSISAVLYSHWDPDHTMGMRIMEQLRLEWLDFFRDIRPQNPVTVYAQPGVMEDLNAIRSRYGSLLDYYEHMGLIKRRAIGRELRIGDVTVSFLSVPKRKAVTVFVFESAQKRLIYAPCDCVPFPDNPLLYDADVLIMGNTFVGDVLKNGNVVTADHPIRKELHSFEDALGIRAKLRAKQLVITHIEEDWGKSLDDYRRLEKDYPQVRFAFDGMTIRL